MAPSFHTGVQSTVSRVEIAETEAYLKAKDKSYYKNRIEKLYDRYNRCIALQGNYIE